jgi:hypothetical protein
MALTIAGGRTPLACFIRDRRGRDTLRTGLAAPRRVPPIGCVRERRVHVDVLPRLAPAVRGRGSPHGRCAAAGGPASFDTGSQANLVAAFCGLGGALAAALLAELFIRARRRANR